MMGITLPKLQYLPGEINMIHSSGISREYPPFPYTPPPIPMTQEANPQRVPTEIIIEMKQLYSGRIASNPFIASNRRYMLFPLRYTFTIENVLLD